MIKPSSLLLSALCLLFLSQCSFSTKAFYTSPNPTATPVNQLNYHLNGCGPSALMTSMQFGSKKWQRLYQNIPGSTERAKYQHIIKNHIKQPSNILRGISRWDSRKGINILDLEEVAQELQAGSGTRSLRYHEFHDSTTKNSAKNLRMVHRQLVDSLKKGYPPLVSIHRFAHRPSKGNIRWRRLFSHYLVIHKIPSRIPSGATSFDVEYIDPWGGQIHKGTISTHTYFSTLAGSAVHFPSAERWGKKPKAGEVSLTLITSSLQP